MGEASETVNGMMERCPPRQMRSIFIEDRERGNISQFYLILQFCKRNIHYLMVSRMVSTNKGVWA